MTAAASPATTIARSARWSSGASGVVAWASLAAWTPPIRVAAVPVIPVRTPAASSAATARNDVVVLPSVPVIPTTASSCARIAVPPRRGRGERGPGVGRRRAAAGRRPGSGVLDERGGRAGRGRRRDEVVAVDVEPGDGHEERARPDVARVVGDAADRDRRPGRPPRSPGRRGGRRAAGPRRSGARSARELGRLRSARRPRAARRCVGSVIGRSSAAARLARRPDARSRAGRRRARGRRSAPATGRRTTACAGRGRTADRPRCGSRRAPATSTPPRSISLRPSRIASWIARQRRRCRAPGMRLPRRRRGRPNGPSTGGRRGGTGSRPAERLAPGIAGARLEVDEVARAERRRPPGDERRARAERELAPLAGLEEEVVEAVEGGRGGLGRGDEALPCPAGPARVSWRTTADLGALGAADPLAGRLGDRRRRRPPRPARHRAAARSGGATAGSPRSGGTRRPRSRGGTPVSAAGTSGSAATTSTPSAARWSASATRRAADAAAVGVDRPRRPARDVGAAATDQRPRPAQRQCPPAVVDRRGSAAASRTSSRWAAQARDW